MEVLNSTLISNQWGTRRKIVKFEGDYTEEELVEKLIHDAPFGYHISSPSRIDAEKKVYQVEVDEYWD